MQKHRGNDCHRPFVLDPENKPISSQAKTFIDKLLLEKIPTTGIARIVEVSYLWLQQSVNAKDSEFPR